MRLLPIAYLTLLPGAAGAAAVDSDSAVAVPVVKGALPPQSSDCPRAISYYAFDPSNPVKPEKLGELPPATAYMTVLRRINGCEVPMTMIEYRNGPVR